MSSTAPNVRSPSRTGPIPLRIFVTMNITILGAALSGLAAAQLARRTGNDVFVTDAKSADKASEAIDTLKREGIAHEFGGHTERALDADLIVTSPGIPPSNAIRQKAVERGIPIIGELEYASRMMTNPVIAVTGTNGKTTTTALTAWILQQSGHSAVTAGNIGTPLSSLVGKVSPDTIIVVEASSYQLDTTVSFRPRVSILTNITPDHLSYHGTFEQYVHAKWKIFANQRDNDVVVLNADDPHAAAGASTAQGMVSMFSTSHEVERGAFVRGDEIILRVGLQHNEEILMPVRRIGLPGVHNLYNSLAATLAARAFEVRNEDIRDSLQSFAGVEHRLEYVRTFHDVRYYNDSKATNVNAAWYALASFDRPIVWIAGGRGDNNDYGQLDDLVDTNVKAVVCIGEETDAIFNHWCTRKRCVKSPTLQDAVRNASELAEHDDIVLFSPACKSFDMFDNFEQRGRIFKDLVSQL